MHLFIHPFSQLLVQFWVPEAGAYSRCHRGKGRVPSEQVTAHQRADTEKQAATESPH